MNCYELFEGKTRLLHFFAPYCSELGEPVQARPAAEARADHRSEVRLQPLRRRPVRGLFELGCPPARPFWTGYPSNRENRSILKNYLANLLTLSVKNRELPNI